MALRIGEGGQVTGQLQASQVKGQGCTLGAAPNCRKSGSAG
jgi:hypothetical protein